MCYYTLQRNAGFGDYSIATTKVYNYLKNNYSNFEFVIIDNFTYNNYHCKELDFVKFFSTKQILKENFLHLLTFQNRRLKC